MRDEAETPVLRRMAGLRAEAAALAEMTPAKALRHALAKAGDDVLQAVVGVRGVAEETLVPADLAEGMPEPALFVHLNGPDGSAGLAVACPQVVAAVIEAQTIGHVLATPGADRPPTRTDAVLASGFLETALTGFAALAAGCAESLPVQGYSCGSALTDARAAQMVMADVEHWCFRIDLDFAGGAKTGKLVLIFPKNHARGAAASARARDWQATLENAVMATTARMEAVLCRLRLPIADLAGLSVGDNLTLTGASLDGLMLVGSDGSTVLRARLGRSGPVRAVRLNLSGAVPRPAPPMADVAALTVTKSAPEADAGAGAGGMAPMDPAPMEPAAMEPMPMEAAPMEPMPMEAAPMEPMPMDAAPMEPMQMEAAPMELEAQPMDMPALAEPMQVN